jgi:hypothetical protein
MAHIDDLIGIAALATLGWTTTLVAQPAVSAAIAVVASFATGAAAAAPVGDQAPESRKLAASVRRG